MCTKMRNFKSKSPEPPHECLDTGLPMSVCATALLADDQYDVQRHLSISTDSERLLYTTRQPVSCYHNCDQFDMLQLYYIRR